MRAGTSQQTQENSLHLIVKTVREHDKIRVLPSKHVVSARARFGFLACSRRHLDVDNFYGNIARSADAAAEHRPPRGWRTQMMVNVQRGEVKIEVAFERVERVEQNDRIDSAGERGDQFRARS